MSFLRDKGASVLNHFRRRVVDGLINCHLRALGLFYKQRPSCSEFVDRTPKVDVGVAAIRQTNNLKQEKTFKWTSRLSSLPTTEQR